MSELLLDRYRELEQIDSGGYGTVILAFDERIRRRVALKRLPLALVGGAPVGQDEARTAALLAHPNIVALYDFEVDYARGLTYLVMEYVDGVELGAIPSDDLTDDVIAAVAKAVGDALAYAHKNGVLHLDIKPANILINHEGQVKITDFGLAQLSGVGGHGRAVGGTLGYMPLEQLRGEAVSELTDQWAFAAVLYELLADEFPYYECVQTRKRGRGTSAYDLMVDAQEKAEPALLELGAPELDAAFAQALSRNPEARFASVREFRDAVLPYLGGVGAVAGGVKELRRVVAELTGDDSVEEDVQPSGERAGFGCGAALDALCKIIAGLAGAVLLLTVLTPQLFDDKRELVAQVSAGVFIILGVFGLIALIVRRFRK
jgi:serine/threonine-protein kinase